MTYIPPKTAKRQRGQEFVWDPQEDRGDSMLPGRATNDLRNRLTKVFGNFKSRTDRGRP